MEKRKQGAEQKQKARLVIDFDVDRRRFSRVPLTVEGVRTCYQLKVFLK